MRHHRYSPESMLRTLSSKYTTPPIHTDLNHLVQIFPIRTILGDISPDFPTFHMRSHSQPCARSHSSHPQRNDQSATRGVSLLRQECRTSTCTLVLLHYPNPGTARLCPIGRMINIYKGACVGVYFSDGLHMKPEKKKSGMCEVLSPGTYLFSPDSNRSAEYRMILKHWVCPCDRSTFCLRPGKRVFASTRRTECARYSMVDLVRP